jgi:hypothetical protein
MKTNVLDLKKITECNLKASSIFHNIYWKNKRLQIAQSFMKSIIIFLLLSCTSIFSINAQDCLNKSYNLVLKEKGAPKDDGNTKDGLLYIWYYSSDEGLHVYYFKKNTCVREEIISSYGRWMNMSEKFTTLINKYDIGIIKEKERFIITIKNYE